MHDFICYRCETYNHFCSACIFRLLDQHMSQMHLNRQVCDKCGRDFGGRVALAVHKETCGIPKQLVKRHQCTLCEVSLRAASSLKSKYMHILL